MKVSELIEKLKKLDPDLTVTLSDSEYGDEAIDDLHIIEDAHVSGWDMATVVQLSGKNLTKEDIDPKYFFPQEPPVYKPSPMMDNLKVVYDSMVQRDMMYLVQDIPRPVDAKYVTFKIHNNRNDKNDTST